MDLPHEHVPDRLYFAYGSNLALRQMRERCADAQPLQPYILQDHRLAFVGESTPRWGVGGVATVVPAPGHCVPGALYQISPADEARLDVFEGVAFDSYRKAYFDIATLQTRALVYIAERLRGEHPPSASYVAVLREGYADWGLSVASLDQCIPEGVV